MKKFKHKKTGIFAEKTAGDYYTLTQDNGIFHKKFIEDTADWEEVVEKSYEITKVKCGEITISFKDGMCVDRDDDIAVANTLDLTTLLRAAYTPKIVEVKRLSDGEVFTIGDKVDIGLGARVIEGFRIMDDKLCVDHDRGVFTNEENGGAFKDAKKVVDLPEERTAERFVQKYTYKDKTYVVLDNHSHKDETTREWVETVRYIQLESGLIFSREISEFYRLFQKI